MPTQERYALYYPSIYFQDVNWLKAALLTFPQIRRIVPHGYQHIIEEHPEIKEFEMLRVGARPLLSQEDPMDTGAAMWNSLEELQEKLEDYPELDRFSSNSQDHRIVNVIHPGKMTDQLIHFLHSKGLVWGTHQDFYRNSWFQLHPQLYKAIMTVIAITIAEYNGLDIVTGERVVHNAVVSRSVDDVFDELIGRPVKYVPNENDAVDDLAELVMVTAFDVSRLTPEQICELHKEGKSLAQFKDALLPIVQRLPNIANPDERLRRLQDAVNEVVEEWHSYKKSLPKFALDAIASALRYRITDPKSITGLGSIAMFVGEEVAMGLTISLVTYDTYQKFRTFKNEADGPYKYLSQIEKAGARLVMPVV